MGRFQLRFPITQPKHASRTDEGEEGGSTDKWQISFKSITARRLTKFRRSGMHSSSCRLSAKECTVHALFLRGCQRSCVSDRFTTLYYYFLIFTVHTLYQFMEFMKFMGLLMLSKNFSFLLFYKTLL